MKILIASTFYYPLISGGAEISTQIIAEGLVKRGHEIEIVTTGDCNKDEIVNGVVVHRIYFPDSDICLPLCGINSRKKTNKLDKSAEIANEFLYSSNYFKIYRELMIRGNYDLVHASGNLYCMGRYNFWYAAYKLGIPVSQALRDPKLCHLDFCGGKFDKILSVLSYRGVKLLHSLIAPSKYMLDYYASKGIINNRSVVIPNAVDVDFLEDINFESRKDTILYVGRLSEEKGLLTLLEAMKYLNSKCELCIIGKGSVLDHIDLPANVVNLGFLSREEVYAYMKNCKAVVLPSEWPEAFGRTIIEAIANGAIAIGSDSGALPEILGSDYIFETKNVKELATLINKVISYTKDEYISEIKKLQRDSTRFQLESYLSNWEAYFGQHLEAYED